MEKATIAIISIGPLQFEGLMSETGEYGIAVPQVADLVGTHKNYASQQFKRILGEKFRPHKIRTELGNQAINFIDLRTFELLLRKLDKQGNPEAERICDTLVGMSLEQLFCDAFGQKFEAQDRQRWLVTRLQSKITRRTFTDAIKDFVQREPGALYPNLYSAATDTLYMHLFGFRAKDLRQVLGTESIRDELPKEHLDRVVMVEDLAMNIMDNEHLHPVTAVQEVFRRTHIKQITKYLEPISL